MPRIKTFSYSSDALRLEWTDGSRSDLAAIWLRDHCQMPQSRDSLSGQRLFDITDIEADIAIAEARLDDSSVTVIFAPSRHQSQFSLQWLAENCYCRNPPHDNRSAAGKQLWHGTTFAQGLPTVSYAEFCADAAVKISALNALKNWGFCRLTEVPCVHAQVLAVIEQFGFVRHTNYGALFEVRSKIKANNLAYTNRGLGCHLDNPYRDPVPSLQLLHCLSSTTSGGESVLQDGFMAAQVLRDENAAHHQLLSSEFINFRFQDQDSDLRARAPMIELDDQGQTVKIRFNNRSLDTLNLAAEKIRLFYAAYRHFAQIVQRPALQINFKLQVGELLLFDNTRILHGRQAYAEGGARHLQGAYSDLDGLYSTLSILQRDAQAAKTSSKDFRASAD